jgi:UPF0755 protein
MKKKIFIAFMLLAVAVAVAGMWAYHNFLSPAVGERFRVVLRSDESYDEMTAKVKRYIEHDAAFAIYAKYIGLDRGIEAGTYTFNEGMTVIEVARVLKFGSDNSVRLVINNARTPEALAGRVAMQIDADSLSILAALRNPELIKEMGYDSAEAMFAMFIPNTYEVYADVTPEAFVRRMKQESDRFWGDELRKQKLERSGLTPYEAMTLASIVHEETSMKDEMARVAGVYINRLERGMLLQADPTLKYAAGDPTIKRVLNKHKAIDSPYNTYIHLGLPPTPIAMPDMAAIEGVLDFERHDYLYFCARPEMDGRHNFARTLKEHNRNAAAYHRALDRMKLR